MKKPFKDLGRILGDHRNKMESEARARAEAEEAANKSAEERKRQRKENIDAAILKLDSDAFRIMTSAVKDLREGGAAVEGPAHVFVFKGVDLTPHILRVDGGLYRWLSFLKLTTIEAPFKGARVFEIGFAHGIGEGTDGGPITFGTVVAATRESNSRTETTRGCGKFTPADKPVSDDEIEEILFRMVGDYLPS